MPVLHFPSNTIPGLFKFGLKVLSAIPLVAVWQTSTVYFPSATKMCCTQIVHW